MRVKTHEDDEKPSISRIKNRRFVIEIVQAVLENRTYLVERARKKNPELTLDIKDDPILHDALMERMSDLINGAELIIDRCRLSHIQGEPFEWTATYLKGLFTESLDGVKDEDCTPV